MIKKDDIKRAAETAKRSLKKITEGKGSIGMEKQCEKTGSACWVTFMLPREAASEAQNISIVGDFNNWDKEANPMKKLRNGDFSATVQLEKGRSYRFRYLIDHSKWENDRQADRYASNPYGSEDSVVEL